MKSTGVRRALVGASVCALTVVGVGAGAASAGEITGNGTYKVVKGKSICAYSGQNDGFHDPAAVHPEEGPLGTARTQSYGLLVSNGLKAVLPSPGTACNPTVPFEE